jgi:hypothetical protein
MKITNKETSKIKNRPFWYILLRYRKIVNIKKKELIQATKKTLLLLLLSLLLFIRHLLKPCSLQPQTLSQMRAQNL